MFQRAAAIGLALALAGCTEQVVLPDLSVPSDAAVVSKDAWSGSDASCTVPMTATYNPLPAQLLILLDRSADMQRSFAGTTREAAVQSALALALPLYSTRIKFGFHDFPSDPMKYQCSPGTCCLNPTSVVQPQLFTSALISSRFQCKDYNGSGCTLMNTDSPSNAALAQAKDDLKYGTDDDVYILLVTSSEPSCSADSHDACASAQYAAGSLGDMGVRIIVLSVGNQPDPGSSCLYQITERGSQKLPDGVQSVYAASSSYDLSNALSAVFSAVARNACTLRASSMVPPSGVQPTVYIGQTYVPPIEGNGQDGWSYVYFSRTKIEFFGSACELWLSPGAAQLTNPDFTYNACTPSWP